jgi:hypothetical protein
LADQDPAADTDQQADVRTTEVSGGQAGDEPVGEDTDQVPARDEGRQGSGLVEDRIEEVKKKARELAEGGDS